MTARSMARALRSILGVAIVAWLVATLVARSRSMALPAVSASPAEVSVTIVAGALAIAGLAALFVLELKALGLYREGHAAFYVRLWFQGYFYRYVPGKLMLLAERVRLGERVGIPRTTSVVLVLWETVLLLGGAGVLAPLALAFGTNRGRVVLGSLLCLVALGAFLPLLRLVARWVPAFRSSVGPLLRYVPVRTQVGLVGGYALVWLLFGISFASTCRWFASGEHAALGAALWFVAAYVAGLAVAFLPAGVGIREAVLVAGLAPSIPPDDALAMALASRIAMTAIELTLVGLSRFVAVPDALVADGG
jgi:glycosyltransferase 2 family protein